MLKTASESVPAPAEKTFKSYTQDQGAKYAQVRPPYHPNLYKTIVNHHTSTGGQLNVLVDVGCGPGLAARALAPQFAHVIGLDPSEGMINHARTVPDHSATGEPIRFEISGAEDLGQHLSTPITDSSVDVITASTAAHWFNMAQFWPRAARVLKPGGTVAVWTVGSVRIHSSVPNSVAIQTALDDFEDRDLSPFFEPGNILTRNLYVDLPLPWTLASPVAEFDEATFVRKQWGPDDNAELLDGGLLTIDLDTLEKILATSSPVQRWREAHPDTAGTERDIIRQIRNKVATLLQEAGVDEGKEVLKGSPQGVLLLVKKRL
ncbi:hypothetical protein G7046_g1856 [Stylonectria norvegica]|nr:hypothetical protein G7046_g1856 [Stylonectria norvegica]